MEAPPSSPSAAEAAELRGAGLVGDRLAADRRALRDRRARPTTLRGVFRVGGRRQGFRRFGEGRNRYVDRLSLRAVLLALFVVLASALDACFTLLHIEGGGQEVNPLMAAALEQGLLPFLVVKLPLTALGSIFLAIHQNFRVAWIALHVAAAAYAALLLYHAVLFVA